MTEVFEELHELKDLIIEGIIDDSEVIRRIDLIGDLLDRTQE